MSHYYSKNPTSESNEKKIIVNICDKEFTFITDSGVFSKKGLDFGTRTLLENINIEHIKGNVLDVGCGYGPIGIYISKLTNAHVDMIDINERSVNLSIKNASLNKVKVNVFASDKYELVDKEYDYIITNPPIRIGKENLHQIVFDAKNYLVKNGELWLVVHKDQGAKTLAKILEKAYEIEIVNKTSGFYVIRAINN